VKRRFAIASLPLIFIAGTLTASAADIKVLSAVPLAPALAQLADQYKRETGQAVLVQSVTTADINRILSANEPFDILLTTTALVDQAAKDGKAVAASRTMVGRVGIGVIVRTGASAPNINTPDTFRQAVLASDALVYNTAGSGQSVQKMFDDMGISTQIQAKVTRPANAAETMDRIIQGKGNEIGFGLISEIRPYETKGVRMVGPLPAALQSYINYEAIVSSGSKLSDDTKRFVQYVTTAAAKKVLASTGVD
jgi:molybdate transport system substrate-binding protein